MKRRMLSILLALALILTSGDFTVFAAERTDVVESASEEDTVSVIKEQESEQEMSEKDGEDKETIENKETESYGEEKTTVSETESTEENKSEYITEGGKEYTEKSSQGEEGNSESETSEDGNSTEETSESETESVENNSSEIEETIIVPELNVTGSNSLGKMLAEALAAETTEIEKNAGYNVFSIEIENKQATVTYETLKDATIVVGIYDEAGTKLLGTGKSEVKSGETTVSVIIDMNSMPSYFYLRGFLIDTVSLRPLCTVYESPMYTREMQEFLKKTTDDFDEDKVINFDEDTTNNFAVAADDTIMVPQNNKGKNQLVSIDYDTQTYVIANADESIASLVAGEIFVYEYEEGELLIVKISEISIGKDGTTVTIIGEETSIEEVFSYVKFDTEAGMDNAEIDDSTCDEGISYKGLIKDGDVQTRAVEGEGSVSQKAAFDIDKEYKGEDESGEESASFKVSGGINLELKASIKVYISFKSQYLEIKLDYSAKLEVKANGKGELKVKLAQFGFSPIAGVYIEIVPSWFCEVSGSIDFSITIKGTVGFKVSSNEGIKNLTSSPTIKSEFKIEATIYTGFSLEPKLAIIHDKIAKVTLEASIGGEIKASSKYTIESKADKRHDCKDCLDGDISAKCKISVGAKLLNWDKLTFTSKWEMNDKVADFYYSVDYNEWGFTECPHYSYRVKILVQDTNESPIFGATVKCIGNDEEKEVVTDTEGKAILYLQRGDWSINAAMSGYADKVEKINIADKAMEVKLVMGIGEIEGKKVKELSLGSWHSSGAITEDGSLYMWGSNSWGQLGDGTTNGSYEPKKILENVKAVSLGHNHSGAITEDGSLYMWGRNYYGQLGDGTTNDSYEPKKILENVKAVSLGSNHSGAIIEDGSLYMWGSNSCGQLGDGTTNDSYEPKKILENVKAVSLGSDHSGAIIEDGSLYMWGYNGGRQLGDGTITACYEPKKILENVKAVSLGYWHSGAITEDGSLYMWGHNVHGAIGDGTVDICYKPKKILENVKAVSLGSDNSGAITEDGSLYMWGTNYYYKPKKILENIKTVSLGYMHSGVITENGSLYMWGDNYGGQLGDGTTTDSHEPIKITIPSDTTSKSRSILNESNYDANDLSDTCTNRVMKFSAIFNNTAVSGNASFTDLTPKETYNIYEIKDSETENILSASNLLYIGQSDADSDGNISIIYEPRETYDSSVIFAVANTPVSIKGASISVSDVYADGTVKMPDVSVYYNGYELEEGTDYELSGQYSATEIGDYTLTVEGIGIFGDEKDVVWHISEDSGKKLGMPTPSIISGSVVQAGTKLILTSENNSLIYYTIDGTNPTNESILYTEPITISESITIKAIAIKENFNNSEIATFTYTVNTDDKKMPLPTASIASGSTVQKGTEVELLCSTKDASIYYTVDGTVPTTDSRIYSKPIVVNTDMTIQAIAVKDGYENSDIATFVYTIVQGQYYTVTFNSNGGTYISTQTVQEHGKASEPTIPTRVGYIFTGWYLNGVLYDFDTEVTFDITLEACWTEIGKVAMPTPNIVSGSTVESGTKLRLISDEGAKIYYTLDETMPTVSSTLFTEDILITQHTVIKAFAVKEGFKDSDIVTFIYDISTSDNSDEMGDVLPEDIPPTGIPNGLWIAGVNDVTYTGKAIKPSVRVYDYKTRLTEKRDYTISYKNNVNANNAADESKAPSVIIKAKGNYSGKETATFKILPIDINSIGFVIEDIAVNPNQKIQKPIPAVTYTGKKLSNKKDFTVTYPDTSANAYKEKGRYAIKITGQGNYAGEKTINLLITDNILITKAKVSKISSQQYTGKALTPTVQVKYGKTVLKQGTDYELTYQNNVKIGVAYAVIKGKGGYSGQKAVPFQITGMAISKATVTGLDTPTAFNGTAITKNIALAVTVDGSQKTLKAGQDYTVIYQNNKNAGTATVIFTGINGYSGTLKKTFKINPYDLQTDTDKKISYNKKLSVPYAKDGSCPEPVIYFNNTKLKKDRDYSLSYKNNKAVNSGIGSDTAPIVVVKGKGNFKGTFSIPFAITSQDMSNLTLTASDKEYKNRANIFATKITVTDTNGKALSAGKDYDKSSIVYTYANAVKLENGVSKKAGAVVEKTDFIPAGTRIQVSVTAKAGGYYTGTAKGIYRIIKSDIKKAKVSIPVQTYTGESIVPKKSDITATVGGTKLTESEFEIVSCINNIKKGNATITIKGKGNYGGTKTIRFKIQSKGFLWWWRK